MKRTQKGFTLIEILAAAVILSASLAVIAYSMGNSFSHFRDARLAEAAQRIATEKLQLAARGTQTYPATGTETQQSTNFDWQLRLITPVDPTASSVTKLACDINWSFRKTPKTLTLERIITPAASATQETTEK